MKFIGGFDFEKRMADLMAKNAQAQEMRSMRANGATLDQVGKAFGLTRARVLQITGKMVEDVDGE
ncbi:MAG: hypothetical protein EOM58_05765 [Clostridia bacterium]|nr:hypothetical protein [Clostridia bacterium]